MPTLACTTTRAYRDGPALPGAVVGLGVGSGLFPGSPRPILRTLTSNTPSEKPRGLVAELRRRRVLRVAGTYGVVAMSLMQAGAVILPAFELPTSAMRLMILSLVAGFPVSILLAYVLDISPTGIRLARRRSGGGEPSSDDALEDDEGAEVGAHASLLARSLEMILLGLALPVLGFALVVLVSSWQSGGREVVRAASAPAESEIASLAVLPLVELSAEGEANEQGGFFARGMHEDILAHLARVPHLKLISRTSVTAYAGTEKSVREIGEELGVEHVLEGSVRRSATQVRVTAQLIRTATDEHVWADQFDAGLEDVFAVQTRIAAAIARALERELARGPDSPEAATPALPVVPAAYDAYQKARDLHRNLDPADRAHFEQAQLLYEEARRLDPRFAPAWLELAVLHAEARWFGLDRTSGRALAARRCLDEARRLASPADRLALAEGIFAYYVDEDYGKAILFFDDAARLAPGDPEAVFYRAMILRRRGELGRARDDLRAALDLDPLNLAYRDEYALTLALAGELEAARGELATILGREPGWTRAQVEKWQLDLELDGDPVRLLDDLLAADRSRWLEPHYTMLETLSGVIVERVALERLRSALDRPAPTPLAHARLALQRAVVARRMGDGSLASEEAEAAQRAFDEAIRSQPSPGAPPDDRTNDAERSGPVPADAFEASNPLEALELRQLAALIAAERGRLAQAVALQRESAQAFPIERDIVTGGPVLWLLAELQLRADELDDAIESFDRLRARMALGSVPFGGLFVLNHSVDFEVARRDPRVIAAFDRWRPDYAARWARSIDSRGD